MLNEEKFLLLKQLNLQKQIDYASEGIKVLGKSNLVPNSRRTDGQQTLTGTSRSKIQKPKSVKSTNLRKKSNGFPASQPKKLPGNIKSKNNYGSTQTFKSLGRNLNQLKVQNKQKGNVNIKIVDYSQQEKKIQKSKSYVLTQAGAIKKITQQMSRQNHFEGTSRNVNKENMLRTRDSEFLFTSSQKGQEIDELTNRYNDYLSTRQSRKDSLVTSNRSLPRVSRGHSRRQSQNSKSGRLNIMSDKQQQVSVNNQYSNACIFIDDIKGFNTDSDRNLNSFIPSVMEFRDSETPTPIIQPISSGCISVECSEDAIQCYNTLQEQHQQLVERYENPLKQSQVQQNIITQQSSRSFQSPAFNNQMSTNKTNQCNSKESSPSQQQVSEEILLAEQENFEKQDDEIESQQQFNQVQQMATYLTIESTERQSINKDLENTFNQAQKDRCFTIQVPEINLNDNQLTALYLKANSNEGSERALDEPQIQMPIASPQNLKRPRGNKSNRGSSTGRESRGTTTRDSRENSKLQKFITDSQQRMSQRSRREGRSTGLKTERSRNNMATHDIELSQEQIVLGCEKGQGHTTREWSAQQAHLLQRQSLESLVPHMSEQSSSQFTQAMPPVSQQYHRRGQSQSKNPSQSNHNQSRDSKADSRRGSCQSNCTEHSEVVRQRHTCTPLAQTEAKDQKDALMKFQTRQSKQFKNHIERNKRNLQPVARSNFLTSRSNTRCSPSMLHSRRDMQKPDGGQWNPFFRRQESISLTKYGSQLNFDLIKPSLKKIKPIRTTLKAQKKQAQALTAKRESKVRSLGSKRDRSNSISVAKKSIRHQKLKNMEFNVNNCRNSLQSRQGCFGVPEEEEQMPMRKPVKRSKAIIQAITNRLYRPKSCGMIPPVLESRNERSTTPCRSQAATERPVERTSQLKTNQRKRKVSKDATGSKWQSKNSSNCTGAGMSALLSKRSSSCGSNLRALQQVASPSDYQDSMPAKNKFKARPFKNKSPFVALKSTKQLTIPQGKSLMTRRMLLLSHERKLGHMSRSNTYALSNSKSDNAGSLGRDSSQSKPAIYPSMPSYPQNDKDKPSNLNYDDAMAKVEHIINSFSSQFDISKAGQMPSIANSLHEELMSPTEQQKEMQKESVHIQSSEMQMRNLKLPPAKANYLPTDAPLSQESNVAVFEVGPGDRGDIQRASFGRQFDLGDNTLDQKIQPELQMDVQKHEGAAQQLPCSPEDVIEEAKHFLRSHSNSFYRKDGQQCSLQLALEHLDHARDGHCISDHNGGSTQEQTLDIKQLLRNQVQILQTGRSSLSSSNQNSVNTSRSQQMENQLLEQLRRQYNLEVNTPGSLIAIDQQVTSGAGSLLHVRSQSYASLTQEEESAPSSPIHKSVYVDEEGPDAELDSDFGSSSAKEEVNETVLFMAPIGDTALSSITDFRSHHNQSRLQASAKSTAHSNLPR